ncbi:hypothetical protein K492DRAFT_194549 [Lichtheimia hyalospora FSU 10163]|nr:hypothetical protein K492DRAFT_194549 [Lichtheimia hyalospora FSU 10163]
MYTGWNQRMQAISRLRWYNVSDLTECCHQLRTLLLSPEFLDNVAQDARPFHQQRLTNLLQGGECPASHIQRFPIDGLYVCEGIGEWGLRVDRLQMTLHLALFPERLQRMYPNIQSPGDAELTVFDALHDILECIGGMVDVIDRNEFEERYHLNWITASRHPTGASGSGHPPLQHHYYPPQQH